MSLLAWYAFPAGALILGALAVAFARWDQHQFYKLYPDERDVKPAVGSKHHRA